MNEELSIMGQSIYTKILKDEEGNLFTGDIIKDIEGKQYIIHFIEGLISNVDGLPAIQGENGHNEYWDKGRLHNETGSAISTNGFNEEVFYIEGEKVTKEKLKK